MARYANMYCEERDAHGVTKRQLARSNERLEDIFSFIRERSLQEPFTEWVLKRDLGRSLADDKSAT